MKKLLFSLLFLSTSAFADNDIPVITNNSLPNEVNSSNVYQSYTKHHIIITKEDTQKFLFIPYKKLVTINDMTLTGTTAQMFSRVQIPYITSANVDIDQKIVYNHGVVDTGLSINISEENHVQYLNIEQTALVSIDNFTYDNMTIQLPTINGNSFSIPLKKNVEKSWTDSSGYTYHLSYIGEKNPIKS